MRGTVLWAVLATLAACQRVENTPPGSQTSAADTAVKALASPQPPPPPAAVATKVAVVEGFLTPESVKYDSAQDVYFVSNVNGGPLAKDNNGFISRVRPDGAIENLKFIEGAHNGVTLNAPKGLALRGDTLWVADIDVVRAYDAKTGVERDSVILDSLVPIFGGNRVEIWQLP